MVHADLDEARRVAVERAINLMLSAERPGPMSTDAEQRVNEAMPRGWEWLPVTSIASAPKVVVTRT